MGKFKPSRYLFSAIFAIAAIVRISASVKSYTDMPISSKACASLSACWETALLPAVLGTVAGAAVTGLPGILLQLIVIPVLVTALKRSGVLYGRG